ncbi:MAG TPA: hypothetical protein VGM44_20930 [Polyangiaceae bacterium]|jgi:hypothetical protein
MKTQALLLSCGALAIACAGHAIDLDHNDSPQSVPTSSSNDAGAGDVVLLDRSKNLLASFVASDGTRLYWLDIQGELQSCVEPACDGIVTYTRVGAYLGIGFVAAGGHIYWADVDGSIYSCPSSGCAGAPTKVVDDPTLAATVVPLSADGDYVYWPSARDLYRCFAAGCGPTPEVVAHGESGKPAFAGTNAYWLATVDGVRAIRNAPKDGSAPAQTFLSGNFTSIATTAEDIFWLDSSNHVLRCPLTGCDTPALVDDSTGEKDALQFDELGLYWLEGYLDMGEIHYCPFSGCSSGSELLAPTHVQSFAVDSTYLYWVETRSGGGGLVHRRPK